jgi:fructose-1,6-bisphosphatase II
MGIGGAPEGVLAAAALKCLGGDMQARLIPYTDEERKRCWEMGIDDINRVMTLDDLVKGDDCIFSATAITDTPMMRGVQYFGGGARTMSVVMRYKSGTIRFIDTFHRFDKKAKWSIHL